MEKIVTKASAVSRVSFMRAIDATPGCGMKHLFSYFRKDHPNMTLKEIGQVRAKLKEDGCVEIVGYNHFLTEKGVSEVMMTSRQANIASIRQQHASM